MKEVAHIKQIDAKLKAIDTMLGRGEHKAAGLTLWIHVGPSNPPVGEAVEAEIAHHTEELLKLLRASLQETRNFYLNSARKTFDELHKFLVEEDLK